MPHQHTHRAPAGLTALLLALAVFATAPATAQEREGWQWLSPLGAEPGTPPQITPVEGTGTYAVFDVVVPGFWIRERIGGDQRTYVEIDVPGAGETMQPGAPKLPLIGFDLAVPTDAEQATVVEVAAGEQVRYEMLVYPRTVPERDHPEGEPEQFIMDEEIYFGQEIVPPEPIVPDPVVRGGPIPHARPGYVPCTWSPTDNVLGFTPEFTIALEFPGNLLRMDEITLERDRLAEALFMNWEFVSDAFPLNILTFEADYLFVYPEDLKTALQPLIDQKKARGYLVGEILVENTTGTCAGIRSAIDSWLGVQITGRDKYCLLVGDTGTIPLCDSPTLEWASETVPTDDLYASPGGDDLDEEIYLGRLSVDDAADLAVQVDKILQYENHALALVDYTRCGLVAHRENAPDKYVGAHESVRTASYATPPAFTTFYGNDASVGDTDVSDFVDSGVGIVAYRGHGSDAAWTTWNTAFDNYDAADVAGIGNGTWTPVVWSFACNNAELGVEDCIGEAWLEETEGGAVAHYGATEPSYTVQNHELDRAMFAAVWDDGLVTHAHAIEAAERRMADVEGSDNAWMYLLLGDPDLKIRRSAPPAWNLVIPEMLPVCGSGPCELTVEAYDEFGRPLEQVLVSAWKPAPAGAKAGDEVFANRYTGTDGRATLAIEPATEGALALTVRDLDGNAFVYDIPVSSDVSAVPGGATQPLRLSAAPSVASGGTTFRLAAPPARGAQVALYDIRGRLVRTLSIEPAGDAVRWDGRDEAGRRVPSGVYYARVTAGGRTTTTRVTMVR